MKKTAIFTALCLILQSLYILTACASYEDNLGTIDLNTMTVTGAGISINGNRIEITQGGDFTVTGENENAMIYVNAQDKVKLRLSGVTLKNQSGPAIFYDNAEKALITITENTENYVEDGTDYGEIDAKAAIFSNDDLEIKGNGSLSVVGNFKHGIASDDDISIENGTINITANVTDGIHVNNTFEISGGTLNISAASDGIQAEEDVLIQNGTIYIAKSEEGIESGTTMTINGGDINITATDDGLNSGGGTGTSDGGPGTGRGGMRPNGFASGQGAPQGSQTDLPEDSAPSSGNGAQPADDGAASGGRRPNGSVPADKNSLPEGESAMPGEQQPDAGLDMSNDASATASVDRSLYINGGTIKIDAGGDGVDSNASIYMTGGSLAIDGPTSGGDGAIDASSFEVSGGTVIALGSAAMAMGVTSGSGQCAFMVNLSETADANSTVTLKDADNNTVFEYTSKKAFSSVIYSSENLTENETYTLMVNGEEKENVEMTQKQVTLGSIGFGGMGGMGRGPGGMGTRPDDAAPSDGMVPPEGEPAGMHNTMSRPQENAAIKILLNGEEISFDAAPQILNDTTFVPARAIFEALGLEVGWDSNTSTVTAGNGSVALSFTIGSTTAYRNGSAVSLAAAPIISSEDRTLVPVRFIAESLGLTVTWDASTKTVSIS